MVNNRELTEDGLEKNFATNTLGEWWRLLKNGTNFWLQKRVFTAGFMSCVFLLSEGSYFCSVREGERKEVLQLVWSVTVEFLHFSFFFFFSYQCLYHSSSGQIQIRFNSIDSEI